MKLAVLSDIHSNGVALKAVLTHAFNINRCKSILFIGDLLGYGPDPITVLETAKDNFTWMVLGNHDALFFDLIHLLDHEAEKIISTFNGDHQSIESILNEALEVNKKPRTREYPVAMRKISKIADYFVESRRNLSATNGYAIDSILRNIVRIKATNYDFEWFKEKYNDKNAFGKKIEEIDDIKLVFVHGTLHNPKDEYLYPWQISGGNTFFLRNAMLNKVYDNFDDGQLCVFSGHTHIPLYLRINNIDDREISSKWNWDLTYEQALPLGNWLTLINPGSVGKPRDNDPRAAYAVINTDQKIVEYFRIEYDIRETSLDMRAQYFQKNLIEQFRTAQEPNNIPNEAYDILSGRLNKVSNGDLINEGR